MVDFWVVPIGLATLLFGFSVFNFFLWLKRKNRWKDLILSLMFLVMGSYCLIASQILTVVEPSQTTRLLRLSIMADEVVAVLFLWYLGVVSGVVSRTALTVWTAFFSVLCVLCLFVPEGLIVVASHRAEFSILLPLGFRATYRFVPLGPFAILLSLLTVPYFLHCLILLFRYAEKGHKREACKIATVFAVVVLSVVNDVLVGTEVYHSMFLTSFGWAIALFALASTSWNEILEGELAVKTLETTQAQFFTMLKNAPMSIWMGDTRGRMLLQNDVNVSLVGNRVGETSLDGNFPQGTEKIWDLNRRALLGEVGEDVVVYRNGSQERTYRVILTPIRSEQRIIGTFGFGVDISTQVLAEKEEERLRAQLLQSQKMESLGLLAGGVAHDMNNILSAILAIASTRSMSLPEGNLDKTAFDKIQKAAERGGKYVKSLLSFARRKIVEEHLVNMNEIVQETISLMSLGNRTGIEVKVQLEPELGLVLGDPNALTTCLMNLCSNAMDAMGESGTLAIESHNLGSESIEILIKDTGAGMTDEVMARAVEPFFTTKPEGAGTGLGLSQVFRIVQTHRGTLELSSQPGHGTTVRMVLPANQEKAGITSQELTVTRGAAKRELSVLVVDDDELVLDAAVETFKALGHRVTGLSSGTQVLSQLETLANINVLVLDLNMPGMNGEEVLIRLRERYPLLPVLLSSGRLDEHALRLVESFPHVLLLPKPYSIDEVRATLEKLFSQ